MKRLLIVAVLVLSFFAGFTGAKDASAAPLTGCYINQNYIYNSGAGPSAVGEVLCPNANYYRTMTVYVQDCSGTCFSVDSTTSSGYKTQYYRGLSPACSPDFARLFRARIYFGTSSTSGSNYYSSWQYFNYSC